MHLGLHDDSEPIIIRPSQNFWFLRVFLSLRFTDFTCLFLVCIFLSVSIFLEGLIHGPEPIFMQTLGKQPRECVNRLNCRFGRNRLVMAPVQSSIVNAMHE